MLGWTSNAMLDWNDQIETGISRVCGCVCLCVCAFTSPYASTFKCLYFVGVSREMKASLDVIMP